MNNRSESEFPALRRRQFLNRVAATGMGVALPLLKAVADPASQESTENRPIRIGQIGVGHGHASKIGVYRQSKDYEVVGIVEPDENLRRAAEGQKVYEGLRWMTQDELLSDGNLQAVLVETHVRDLLDTAEACVAAGKHLHLDKPAGNSLPQFQRLLESAERQNLIVQMGYMWRYHPAVILLRQLLQKNWLGEIFEVTAVIGKPLSPRERSELAEFSGGMMFEMGCHLLDLVVGILGEPASVTSYRRHLSSEDALLDHAIAILEYPRTLGSVRVNALEVNGTSRRRLIVNGTEGSLHIQPLDGPPRARLTLSTARGEYRKGDQELTFPAFHRYIADAAEMARLIRGGSGNLFPYEHDLAVQRTLLLASGMPLD